MLMVVVRQITSWTAQASMYYVVKETSVCWVKCASLTTALTLHIGEHSRAVLQLQQPALFSASTKEDFGLYLNLRIYTRR